MSLCCLTVAKKHQVNFCPVQVVKMPGGEEEGLNLSRKRKLSENEIQVGVGYVNVRSRKMLIVGEEGSGKSSLGIAWTTGIFPFSSKSNPKNSFQIYREKIVGLGGSNGRSLDLWAWEIPSNQFYDHLRICSYADTDVVAICYSVDSRPSFDAVLQKWGPEVERYAPPGVAVLLVGTKVDLRYETQGEFMTTEDGRSMADKIHAQDFIESSAKNQINVQLIFDTAARLVLAMENSNQ